MRLRTTHLALAASITSACAGTVLARQPADADSGPVIVGERKAAWNLFDLQSYGAGYEFLGSTRKETTKQDGQPTLEDKENILRNTFDLFGEAFIGHKNLIDLTGKFRLQFENRDVTSGTLNSDQKNTNLDLLYDVNAHVLGASAFPMDIYGRHDQQNLSRDFGTSLNTTNTTYGIAGALQSTSFPTSLRLEHNETTQTDLSGRSDNTSKRDTFAGSTLLVLSDQHRLEGHYTLDSLTESQPTQPTDTYLRHDLSLTEIYAFGEKNFGELRTYVRYYQQGGLFDQETLRGEQQLRLTHSSTLESRYNISAEQRSQGISTQDTYRGGALVRHKLFESLVSTANIGAQRFSTEDFVSDEYFAGGNLEYTKKVYQGRLDASVGINFNNQNNGEQGTTIPVFNEAFVFSGGLSIIIPRRNIVFGSLTRVTGPGGFPVFTEGFDYTVSYFPDRVEIVPIPGRGISAGSTVLVNYDIGPEPANTINTLSTSASVRYTITETWLQGLAGYGSYRTTTHSIDAVDPSLFVLDDVHETIVGTEYRRYGLLLRAEQEFRQSTVNPYDTTRLQALYDMRLGVNSVLGFDVTNELIKYSTPENKINFTRAGVRWLQQLGQTLDLDTRVIYRNEKNDLAGNSDGIDAKIGLRWHLRQTSAYITFGNTVFGTATTDTTSRLLEIGFRRDF